MSRFKKQIISGMCICGHKWDRHHLGMIVNPEAYEIMGPSYAQECEAFGFNETGGLNPDGSDHCHHYIDVEDKERIKEWKEKKARWEKINEKNMAD